MIGNDVVDLNRWKPPLQTTRYDRWIHKLFTRDEQAWLHKSTDQKRASAWLWSVKESLYKYHVQQGAHRGFYPKRIRCPLPKEEWKHRGQLPLLDRSAEVHWRMTEKSIHSWVGDFHPCRKLTHQEVYLADWNPERQSEVVRGAVLDSVAKSHGISTDQLMIGDNQEGVPQLFVKQGHRFPWVGSWSHDGPYLAFVYY